jgi:catechol-2,3-dioxygenase
MITMAEVTRLNHAVLYVSDLARSLEFYQKAFGFKVVDRMGDQAVFLRAAHTENHHDLALMSVGAAAPRPARGSVGLYHLAWQVATMEELAEMASRLSEMDALAGMSDHGVSKSLYAQDPDGIEFEVMFEVPRDQWGDYAERAVVQPLDMRRELERFGKGAPATG